MRITHYDTAYYERDTQEQWFSGHGLPRPDELAAICYAHGRSFVAPQMQCEFKPRDPGLVYSIGCGRGDLDRMLLDMGCLVVGVDPSPGAAELYRGDVLLAEYPGGGDTVIFCESLEHLTEREFEATWERIPSGARVVVVNWLDFHPIEALSEWDHVRRVDDDLFDRLSAGHDVVFRRGAHLVLDRR